MGEGGLKGCKLLTVGSESQQQQKDVDEDVVVSGGDNNCSSIRETCSSKRNSMAGIGRVSDAFSQWHNPFVIPTYSLGSCDSSILTSIYIITGMGTRFLHGLVLVAH